MMKLRKAPLVLILAGSLLAVLFMALGLREFLRPDTDSEIAGATAIVAEKAVAGVVARASRPIAVGETITGDMIVNARFDPSRHARVATPEEIIGRVAVRPIAANALISREWIDLGAKLAIRVPLGRRAISLDTNAEIAVAGLVRPGDLVDVQVVYPGSDALSGARPAGPSRTETVLQTVQVLAVGELVLGSEEEGTTGAPPARTVTLALTPDEVAVLALAKSTGTIQLSLRNPMDADYVFTKMLESDAPPAADPVRMVGFAEPEQAAPRPRRRTAPARASTQPSRGVDLVIGARRETLFAESK